MNMKKYVQFARKSVALLAFQSLREVNLKIFKMAASICLLEVRTLICVLLNKILILHRLGLWQIAWFNNDLHLRSTCFKYFQPAERF